MHGLQLELLKDDLLSVMFIIEFHLEFCMWYARRSGIRWTWDFTREIFPLSAPKSSLPECLHTTVVVLHNAGNF